MRLNGQAMVARMALQHATHPLLQDYGDAVVLGALREDVWHLPGGIVIEHWSLSHFYKPGLPGGLIPFLWPGARMKSDMFFKRAVRAFRQGKRGAAFVQLGRVVHLLVDMACPVHAQRTIHDTDLYEWYVEGNCDALMRLPLPELPRAQRASGLIASMSAYSQAHRADATNSLHGRWLKKRGYRQGLTAQEAAGQAAVLIPQCAAHTLALFDLLLAQVEQPAVAHGA